jgi:predicted TIM-barrel fold metal-dependent hydrolase
LHEDVEPYHKALVQANPERILWGSDWPFLGMNTYRPEPGALLDLMDRWIEHEGIKELALVKNPERLYFST